MLARILSTRPTLDPYGEFGTDVSPETVEAEQKDAAVIAACRLVVVMATDMSVFVCSIRSCETALDFLPFLTGVCLSFLQGACSCFSLVSMQSTAVQSGEQTNLNR